MSPDWMVSFGENDLNLKLTLGRVMLGKQNGVDLGDLENGPVTTLLVDPETVGHTVWSVFADRLEAIGIANREAFFGQLDGEQCRKLGKRIEGGYR